MAWLTIHALLHLFDSDAYTAVTSSKFELKTSLKQLRLISEMPVDSVSGIPAEFGKVDFILNLLKLPIREDPGGSISHSGGVVNFKCKKCKKFRILHSFLVRLPPNSVQPMIIILTVKN